LACQGSPLFAQAVGLERYCKNEDRVNLVGWMALSLSKREWRRAAHFPLGGPFIAWQDALEDPAKNRRGPPQRGPSDKTKKDLTAER